LRHARKRLTRMLSGLLCAPATFRRFQVPCSHLVEVSYVGGDKHLYDHAQHDH
jgi:hypothetical protein